MKAYDRGYLEGIAGKPHVKGRAYETDKANKAYFQGYAMGLHVRHKDRKIVKCNSDSTIFAAIVVPYITTYVFPDGTTVNENMEYIECPTCARRYFKDSDGVYHSDRDLTILHEPV